jgi:hypothetical protein
LADFPKFHHEFPSEFIWISMSGFYNDDDIDGKIVSTLIHKYLEPSKLAVPSTFPQASATFSDLRATGRCFSIRCPWVPAKYHAQSRGETDTYNSAYNCGELKEGKKLYDYIRGILKNQTGLFGLSFYRSSGDAPVKHNPVNFMLQDRTLFMELMEIVDEDPQMLAKISQANLDVVTFDFVQTGRILLWNSCKNLVMDEKEDEFVRLIRAEIG